MIRIVNTMMITAVDPNHAELLKDISTVALSRAMIDVEKICREKGIDSLISQSGPTIDPSVAGVPDDAFNYVWGLM